MGLFSSRIRPPPYPGAAVLITGAGTGIGLEVCLQLASEGWHVFACVLNENQKLELESFTSKDPITDAHVHPLVVNLRFDDSVTRAYEIVKALIVSRNSEINSLLAIVNNAAVTNPGPLECVPISKIRETMDVIAIGSASICQTFLPLLRDSRKLCVEKDTGFYPKIINVSSGAGMAAVPFHGAYSMAKHALESFSDCLRREVQHMGIQVVVVQPGMVNTASAHNWPTLVDNLWSDLAEANYKSRREMCVAQVENLLSSSSVLDAVSVGKSIGICVSKTSSRFRVRLGMETYFLVFLTALCPDFLLDLVLNLSQYFAFLLSNTSQKAKKE